MATDNKKQVPCREGLWSTPLAADGKPQLIGSKCSQCGEVFFPVNPVCVNCQNQTMNEIKLSRRGKVWSFSAIMLPPPRYKGEVPFHLGYVELPEGIKIWTRILKAEVGGLQVGQEVELEIDIMEEDDEGNEVLGYCFVPLQK